MQYPNANFTVSSDASNDTRLSVGTLFTIKALQGAYSFTDDYVVIIERQYGNDRRNPVKLIVVSGFEQSDTLSG